MLLLIIFAFLAGIVTVLSPCILPVLPIVLSSAVGGGKKRPFGIIAGFVISFTFFTLFLSSIVTATHIPSDSLRTFSVIVIAVFGASLLIPQFQVWTEKAFSRLSGLIPVGKQGSGFGSGFIIGVSLGLLWTPCVGPILASVISLALTGSVSGSAIFITLAYSLGTAIPMFAILYGGRSLLQKVPWLLSRSGQIQKVFGFIMIITAIGIFYNLDRKFQTYILTVFPQYGAGLTKIEDNAAVRDQLQKFSPSTSSGQNTAGKTTVDLLDQGTPAPEFIPGGQWFNVEGKVGLGGIEGKGGLELKQLRGKVVLVDFWTYTCINCIRTLPYIKDWYAKYKDKGFVVIGVHTPEFAFEKESQNVQQAIKDFGIEYPVVQDNDYATWRAYDNHYWPAKYFIDKNGNIRKTHFGEGDYDESEQIIQQLLKETGQTVDNQIHNKTYTVETQTPETYVGFDRLQYSASPEQVQVNVSQTYSAPKHLPNSSFAYIGSWMIGNERAMPTKGSSLLFNFSAKDVYLVMRPKKTGVLGKITVTLDGKPVGQFAGADSKTGTVVVNQDRLYKLIHLPLSGDHLLQLKFLDDNLELYAFTFG
jgi:cytochrome c biogenesis protein CcdA/thiol-disulfide isomerase/thioredoxin